MCTHRQVSPKFVIYKKQSPSYMNDLRVACYVSMNIHLIRLLVFVAEQSGQVEHVIEHQQHHQHQVTSQRE
jgi:hypothetical protein